MYMHQAGRSWVQPWEFLQQEGERRRMQPSNSLAVRRHLHVTVVPIVRAGSEVQFHGQDSTPCLNSG